MNVYQLKRCEIKTSDWLGKRAKDDPSAEVISKPGVYTVDGKPVIIYGRFSERYDRVVSVISRMPWITGKFSKKTLMGKSETRNFGFCTRRMTKDYCHPAGFALDSPMEHKVLCEMGRLLNRIYEEFAPDTAAAHSEALKAVLPEWMIPGTRFTSGIVNNSNTLPYHYDSGNHENVFSCMVVFRKLCDGGNLHLPEFNASFLIEDHSFFLFDGQALLHGVTPMKLLNKNGYRYSVVYYSRRGMGKCGTAEEEMRRIRTVKREREWKRTGTNVRDNRVRE